MDDRHARDDGPDGEAQDGDGAAGTSWAEETSDAFGESAAASFDYQWVPSDGPTLIVLDGPCPRCHDEFTYEWPLEVARALDQSRTGGVEPVTVYCQCRGTHSGRPDDLKRGCGAYWHLDVPQP